MTRSRGNIFPLDACLVLAFSSPPSEHQSYISLQVTAIFIMSDLLHVIDKYFQLMMSYNKGCQGAFHVNSTPEIRQHVRSFTPTACQHHICVVILSIYMWPSNQAQTDHLFLSDLTPLRQQFCNLTPDISGVECMECTLEGLDRLV